MAGRQPPTRSAIPSIRPSRVAHGQSGPCLGMAVRAWITASGAAPTTPRRSASASSASATAASAPRLSMSRRLPGECVSPTTQRPRLTSSRTRGRPSAPGRRLRRPARGRSGVPAKPASWGAFRLPFRVPGGAAQQPFHHDRASSGTDHETPQIAPAAPGNSDRGGESAPAGVLKPVRAERSSGCRPRPFPA